LRHPAEALIKYLIVKGGTDVQAGVEEVIEIIQGDIAGITNVKIGGYSDVQIIKYLDDIGFLKPTDGYLQELRKELLEVPDNFDPFDKSNRESMQFLRSNSIYELFHPTQDIKDAWDILQNHKAKQIVEQVLLARAVDKALILKINQKHLLNITEGGVQAFGRMFWNVDLLSFDQWGRYLYERNAMYSDYMALLRAPTSLLLFKLRLEQQVESKQMIKRAQEIASHTLEQVNTIPGTDSAKVKAIGVLTKSVVDCDYALSASDAALGSVLKEFERFRASHKETPAPDIKQLTKGVGDDFSGSGKQAGKVKANQ